MVAFGIGGAATPRATSSLDGSHVRALALDYDGTLAFEGRVAEATTGALGRVKASGRRLLMVTGREVRHLIALYRYLPLFDAVVAENGAVLYKPALAQERLLSPSPPPALIGALQSAGVQPLALGRVIISTPVANEDRLRSAIEAAGASWRTIRNKASVMALPVGVDKATGLATALRELGLSARETLGVGDAENDEPFLAACGTSAAPADALASVKAMVDIVASRDDGAAVAELIYELLRQDAERGRSSAAG
jgi:hydroxymethylpyrimidine pyrophosphatase-like HAD family hydrolase